MSQFEHIAGDDPRDVERSEQDQKTAGLVAEMGKYVDLAATCSAVADRQRYYRHLWFLGESLANHAAVLSDPDGRGWSQ